MYEILGVVQFPKEIGLHFLYERKFIYDRQAPKYTLNLAKTRKNQAILAFSSPVN